MAEFVKVEWFGDQIEQKIRAELGRRMDKSGQTVKRELIQILGTPSRSAGPSAPGSPPHADTGRLRKSIFHEVTIGGTETSLVVGTTVLYGKFLELGAIITPKTAKALTIPVSPQAKQHLRNGGKASNFNKPLVLISRKGRAPLLVEVVGKGKQRSIIHFVLSARVVLKPRPWLKPTFNRMLPKIHDILFTPPIG